MGVGDRGGAGDKSNPNVVVTVDICHPVLYVRDKNLISGCLHINSMVAPARRISHCCGRKYFKINTFSAMENL